MNRRVALASVAMLALAGFLAWLLRAHLLEVKSHEREVLSRAAQKKAQFPPPPIDAPQAVTAAQYFDVAQHMLFSKDRNPTEIVEVKAPPPKPPLPPLPSYYGQIRLGDPAIILGSAGAQKSYHAGDKVGEKDKYVIVSFDENKITLAFNDEKVEKKLEDLRPKQAPPEQNAGARPAAAAATQNPQSGARSLSLGGASAGETPKPDEVVGASYGSGFYACVAGDTSPDGTIKDGKRKVVSHTMFGQTCHWETVK